MIIYVILLLSISLNVKYFAVSKWRSITFISHLRGFQTCMAEQNVGTT